MEGDRKFIMSDRVSISKKHEEKPHNLPHTLELKLLYFNNKFNIVAQLEGSSCEYPIDSYAGESEAKYAYRAVWKKLQEGDFDILLGYDIKQLKLR